MTLPEITPELAPLFQPRSVAVVGATNNRNKWGYSTFRSLMNSFPGELYAVNKRDPNILGHTAYAKVTDIPGHVDLAVIVVPPDGVVEVMEDCVQKGVRSSVVITAGFSEIGPAGKAMQDEVVSIARRGGIRFVGPNCMGMWSAAAQLPAFMFPMRILEGPLALISQGGNVGGALVADATARGIGFRYYVSCGCTADIQIEDYIEYMGYDESVKVIMVYIEGLNNDNRFVEKVSAISLKKPVIVLKPGKTEAAARAISSHSGSMAGLDAIYKAAFRKAGVIRTESTTELLDMGIAFLTQPLPRGRNVVITTPGGSYGVMCAEACALRGLNVIDLPTRALEAFNSMFPARWSHGNPVDPAGDRNFVQYLKAPDILLRCPEVDALIFMGLGSFSGMSSVFAGDIEDLHLAKFLDGLAGFRDTAKTVVEVLAFGDRSQIREIIKQLIGKLFNVIMRSDVVELEEFLDTVSTGLTTEKMMRSSLYEKAKDLFASIAAGDVGGIRTTDVLELMEPIIGALVGGLIQKYGKPVITTTFTEENSRISEDGHFPYPNSDRASNVLAKLAEYGEYLEKRIAEQDHSLEDTDMQREETESSQ